MPALDVAPRQSAGVRWKHVMIGPGADAGRCYRGRNATTWRPARIPATCNGHSVDRLADRCAGLPQRRRAPGNLFKPVRSAGRSGRSGHRPKRDSGVVPERRSPRSCPLAQANGSVVAPPPRSAGTASPDPLISARLGPCAAPGFVVYCAPLARRACGLGRSQPARFRPVGSLELAGRVGAAPGGLRQRRRE